MESEFDFMEINLLELVGEAHIHMNGFARRLVFTRRHAKANSEMASPVI